ncbi:MAG: acetolactate synthase small subunit [Lachnospiraceae bacterium]|jgi:acetolactate synthase, small subunit|nr:acetolactate synthase small subunit [Lachnoclostridium sp.]MDD7522350.1 acetolactate synthase small subunit [Lachnoclostridium sp.]MDY2598516.1 acetolactate synthase small subunit [Lachnospiraceae bacterium]
MSVDNKRMVLSILVDNTSGVLSRVAGLFSRRGYNIDSLTVGETEHPDISRMTVVARGEDSVLEQITKQLSKLEDVKEIVELERDTSVCRELVLVKVAAGIAERTELNTIANIFRANVVDVSSEIMMMEMTGTISKIDAFIKLLDGFEIKELVRTGITGLTRGSDSIAD